MTDTINNTTRRGRPPMDRSERIIDCSVNNEEKKILDNSYGMTSNRPRRREFSNGLSLKMNIANKYQREDMVLRWVCGTPQRIEQMRQLDWDFVIDPDLAQKKGNNMDTRVSLVVGSNREGGSRRDYLMYIPKEWYNDAQKGKNKILDEIEEQINSGSYSNDIEPTARNKDIEKKIKITRR